MKITLGNILTIIAIIIAIYAIIGAILFFLYEIVRKKIELCCKPLDSSYQRMPTKKQVEKLESEEGQRYIQERKSLREDVQVNLKHYKFISNLFNKYTFNHFKEII